MKTSKTIISGIILANLSLGGLGCAARSNVASDANVASTEQREVVRSVSAAPAQLAQGYATPYRNSATKYDGVTSDPTGRADKWCTEVAEIHDVHYCEGPFFHGSDSYRCVFVRHDGAPITEQECDDMGAAEGAGDRDHNASTGACNLRWY